MKENGKLTEKIVKGLIIAGGTLIGMAVSAFVKTKEDPVDDSEVTSTEVPAENEVTEEVTEG